MEKLKINVYLTTRDDPVEDLDTIEDFNGLMSWKNMVKQHAIKAFSHDKMDESLIKDLKDYAIMECYGIIAFPGDDLSGANMNGKALLQFLKRNNSKLNWALEETGVSKVSVEDTLAPHKFVDPSHFWDNFTYALIFDKELKPGQYEIDLEFVVKPK